MDLENQSKNDQKKIALIAIGMNCEGPAIAAFAKSMGSKYSYDLEFGVVDSCKEIEETAVIDSKFFFSVDRLDPDDSVALRHFLKEKDLVYLVTDIGRAENAVIVECICAWIARSGTSMVFAIGNKDGFKNLRASENTSRNFFIADIFIEIQSKVPLSFVEKMGIFIPRQRQLVSKMASAFHLLERILLLNGSADIDDFTVGVKQSKTILFATILATGVDRAVIAGRKISSLIKPKKPYLRSLTVLIEACPTMPLGQKTIMQEIRKHPKINDESTLILVLWNFDNSLGLSEIRVTALAAE